jgi:hypothetical protein
MIGGIKVFLPYSPVEASVCVSEAATEERKLVETVMEKEMEQISEATQVEDKEHSEEWLRRDLVMKMQKKSLQQSGQLVP